MSGFIREITIILLDISRSMFRRDFIPSRWHIAKQAISHFLEEKHRIDSADKCAVVTISEKPQILLGFDDSLDGFLKEWSKKPSFLTNSPLSSMESWEISLLYAINLLESYIRMIGGQIYRILLFTDKFQIELTPRLWELCKKAAGLNIYLDLCLLIHKTKPFELEFFEKMTKETKGELGFFYNPKAVLKGIQGFASKKIVEENSTKLLNSREKDDAKYLAEVALYLRVPTVEELDNMKNTPKEQIKCQICFSYYSPSEKIPLSKSGRYCPSCGMLMHLQCAGLWAQKTEVAPNLFRCPHCYTLLKLDVHLLKGLELRHMDKIQAKNTTGELKRREVKMIKVNELPNLVDTICYYCFQKISNASCPSLTDPVPEIKSERVEKIFRCSSCAATFHETCLESMYKTRKSCQNCDGQIV